MRYKTNDEKYSKNSTFNIISAYRHQAKTVAGAIKAFVESETTDGNDYIIEGYHVEPKLIKELMDIFSGNVRGVILIKKDVIDFQSGLRKSSTPNDWILSKTQDEATFSKIAAMVIEYGSLLEDEASKLGVKATITDGDFAHQLQSTTEYLLEPVNR